MLMENPERFKWVIQVDPKDATKTVGEPSPCEPGMVGWAIANGYRELTGAARAAAIAAAKGEQEPAAAPAEAPAAPLVAPATETGVKSTVNKAAKRQPRTQEPPPAE